MRRFASTPADHDWLTAAERSPRVLPPEGTLAQAVAMFQRDTDLRLLPVVDAAGRPRGAIFEKDVRRLLLNPFGHALLQNPTISSEVGAFLRPCPVHEVDAPVAALIDHYRRHDGREGMMLTRGGRLFATLSNRRLLLLATKAENEAAAARSARARRIEAAAREFEQGASGLSEHMAVLANAVQDLAEATLTRASLAGNEAAAAASAAGQTNSSMSEVAERGDSLAKAFGKIEQAVQGNRQLAGTMVAQVGEGAERAAQLL